MYIYNMNNINIKETYKNKIIYLQNIIKKTVVAVQKYKLLDLFTANELNMCFPILETIFSSLETLLTNLNANKISDYNIFLNSIQELNNEIASIFRCFGTGDISDLIGICLGFDYEKTFLNTENLSDKYQLIKTFCHPIGYKVIKWKNKDILNEKKKITKKNKIIEDFQIADSGIDLDCFDLSRSNKNFYAKVHGIKISLHNYCQSQTLVISALVDDIMLECLNDDYVKNIINTLQKMEYQDNENFQTFKKYINCICLKDLLIFDTSELYSIYTNSLKQIDIIKQKTISMITREFLVSDLYTQRNLLIQLLLKENWPCGTRG